MTTACALQAAHSSQNEINNNSNSLNAENNNDSVSDEENTSEYGHSPPVEPSAIHSYPQLLSAADNCINNNQNETVPPSLVSSIDSDNILNNNTSSTNDVPDRSDVDDDTSGAYYNALADTSSISGPVQRDSNDNHVQGVRQVQVK